ncbi:MAG: hypothetical protein K6B45_03370 [Bacteroidaceae bacterium]|nr:hypothetical protein [Bacteroidaceae bacterium]
MFKYIFQNFLHTLRRYKASSLLNIVGMAVAFAAFYVIVTQVSYGFGYNHRIPGADRIYQLSYPSPYNNGKYNTFFSRPFGERLIACSPTVEAGGMAKFGGPTEFCFIKEGDDVRKFPMNVCEFTSGGVQVFGFEPVQGSLDELARPGTVAVSAAFAAKMNLHLGDRISQNSDGVSDAFEIVAIWRDFPRNSDLGTLEALYDIRDESLENTSQWNYNYWVRLRSADDRAVFEESMRTVMREMLMDDGTEDEDINGQLDRFRIHLVPLRDHYYASDLEWAGVKLGNRTTDVTLLAVAILILLIAFINFVNFFFALVPVRMRAVNTYKVYGASRGFLVANFVFEAVGTVVVALGVAALVVLAITKSSLTGMLSAPVAFGQNVPVVLTTVAVTVAAAVAGSLYPSFYITKFQVAMAVKGSFGGSAAGRRLRSILMGVQFVISIGLIICATFIRMQHAYMMNYDMGFDKEHLLTGFMSDDLGWYGQSNHAFEDRLRSNPDIKDIAWAAGPIVGEIRMGWGRAYKGRQINMQTYPVSPNFLSFMGIPVVEGRDFLPSDDQGNGVFIFNEQGRKEYDIELDDVITGHRGDARVVGICRDFHYKPLQYRSEPFVFYVFGEKTRWQNLSHIFIRTRAGANPAEVMKFVLDTAHDVSPATDMETVSLRFFDEELGRQYQKERELARLVTLFTLIAIVLSLMGVFGLVLFETQRRSKEIAIRRVLGSEVKDILALLNGKFVRIVLASFALAAPVSWLLMSRYFSTFAYHTPVRLWVFAVALVAVLVVTVAIVTLRSLHAATSNPVEMIKTE